MTHASLSNRGFADVWTSLFPPAGAPKKAVNEPCLSFFGVVEDTAAETEEVAFLLRLMGDDGETVTRTKFS